MGREEAAERLDSTEQQQGTGGDLLLVREDAERARDLAVGQPDEDAVAAVTRGADEPAEPFELERVEVFPRRAAHTQRRPVDCSPVDLVGEHLVSVVRDARRSTVPGDRAPQVGASRGPDHPRAVRNHDDKHLATGQLDDLGGHRNRRLRVVRDQCLNAKWVGAAALVSWPRSCDRPVVLDSYEENASAPVRQADHGLHKVTVVEALPLLALELDVVPFSSCCPARHLSLQLISRRSGGRHLNPPMRLLCAILHSGALRAHNYARSSHMSRRCQRGRSRLPSGG